MIALVSWVPKALKTHQKYSWLRYATAARIRLRRTHLTPTSRSMFPGPYLKWLLAQTGPILWWFVFLAPYSVGVGPCLAKLPKGMPQLSVSQALLAPFLCGASRKLLACRPCAKPGDEGAGWFGGLLFLSAPFLVVLLAGAAGRTTYHGRLSQKPRDLMKCGVGFYTLASRVFRSWL